VHELIKAGILMADKWYRFNTLKVAVQATRLARDLLIKRLENKKDNLYSKIEEIPLPVISFLVHNYISVDLYFDCDEEWIFDWRKVILDNEEIKKIRGKFFQLLLENKICVKIQEYVSTRGGELRGFNYVISPEIRSFLVEITPHVSNSLDVEETAKIIHLIKEQIINSPKGNVEVTIRQEDLLSIGSLKKFEEILDSLINKMHRSHMFVNITSFPDVLTTIIVDKDELLRFIENEIDQSIVKPLFSDKYIIEEIEKKPEIDFPRLVHNLVRKKYDLYVTAAQFEGKELFKSRPSSEQCIVNLATPSHKEQGLKLFINDLHQLLEESSDQDLLKFREGLEYPTLEEWLGLEHIPQEVSGIYEDTKSFFHDLNTLRNYYSHLSNAKGIYCSGLIFRKLIGKFMPEEHSISLTQKILLEKSIESLEALKRILEVTLRARNQETGHSSL